MKIMLLAAGLITLPAISIVLFFFGRAEMIPALASLSINLLPFIVGGILLKNAGGLGEH
jgi:hypothetical protein